MSSPSVMKPLPTSDCLQVAHAKHLEREVMNADDSLHSGDSLVVPVARLERDELRAARAWIERQ